MPCVPTAETQPHREWSKSTINLVMRGLIHKEQKHVKSNVCLPRPCAFKENMLEIRIFEHYTLIFRTYYTDWFRMLVWRREDVKAMCGSCSLHLLKKRNVNRNAGSRNSQTQHGGNAARSHGDPCSLYLDFVCKGRA